MEPPDEINVNAIDENDVKKCVSDMIFSIIGDQRIPYDKIADYIVGDDDSASMEVLMATLNSMRLIHKESNKLDKKKLYVLLSTLKMTGMTVFDVEKFRQNEKIGFTYAKNGKSYSFICDICDKNIGKNNKSKHRNVCPVIKPDDNCERCGMNVNFHPFVDKKINRTKFCPIENIICEYCKENMISAEYFIFHRNDCGNKEDAKCVWCFKMYMRREIANHVSVCGKIDDHMKICMIGVVGNDYESKLNHNKICRTNYGNEIDEFISKWKVDAINHYVKMYKISVLPYFIESLNDRRKFGNLAWLGIISDQPDLMGDDPVKILDVSVNEIENIDDIYRALKDSGFLGSNILVEQGGTSEPIRSKKLFRLVIRTITFAFWITCDLFTYHNKSPVILLSHVRADYKDDDLNYYVNDANLKGYFGPMRVILNDNR